MKGSSIPHSPTFFSATLKIILNHAGDYQRHCRALMEFELLKYLANKHHKVNHPKILEKVIKHKIDPDSEDPYQYICGYHHEDWF